MDTLLVRPYTITAGRTHGHRDLTPTASVRTDKASVGHLKLRPELLKIIEFCRTTRRLSEIAARLDVPIGVAAVLLDDLVTLGLVTVTDRVMARDQGGRHRAAGTPPFTRANARR